MTDGPLVAKVGNVTRAGDLRYSPQGKAVIKFGIAVNPYVPPGQPKAEAQFYDVTAFGSLAENAAETLKRGSRVVVVGTGKTEEWVGKDGQPRTSKVIIADGFGPDLRFATAVLHASERKSAAAPAQPYAPDEEPF